MLAGRRKGRGARRRELPAKPELGGCDARSAEGRGAARLAQGAHRHGREQARVRLLLLLRRHGGGRGYAA